MATKLKLKKLVRVPQKGAKQPLRLGPDVYARAYEVSSQRSKVVAKTLAERLEEKPADAKAPVMLKGRYQGASDRALDYGAHEVSVGMKADELQECGASSAVVMHVFNTSELGELMGAVDDGEPRTQRAALLSDMVMVSYHATGAEEVPAPLHVVFLKPDGEGGWQEAVDIDLDNAESQPEEGLATEISTWLQEDDVRETLQRKVIDSRNALSESERLDPTKQAAKDAGVAGLCRAVDKLTPESLQRLHNTFLPKTPDELAAQRPKHTQMKMQVLAASEGQNMRVKLEATMPGNKQISCMLEMRPSRESKSGYLHLPLKTKQNPQTGQMEILPDAQVEIMAMFQAMIRLELAGKPSQADVYAGDKDEKGQHKTTKVDTYEMDRARPVLLTIVCDKAQQAFVRQVLQQLTSAPEFADTPLYFQIGSSAQIVSQAKVEGLNAKAIDALDVGEALAQPDGEVPTVRPLVGGR